ncbi:MAG: hypothetical protein ACXW05_06410 [Gemmatirosa sp.]
MSSESPAAPGPAPIPDAELAVARAVAQRLGRPVFAIVLETGGRRLAQEPPEDLDEVAYAVDHRGRVRYGHAGRPPAPPAGAALVRDPATIPPVELAAARDLALATGATVFVAAPDPSDPEGGVRYALEAPSDGSLRFAVRPMGTLLTGDAAREEVPRRIADASWGMRTGPALRTLRRLADRGEALAALDVVSARDWGRVERLVPKGERDALHPKAMVGLTGAAAAERIAAAVARELARLRGEAERLFEQR